MPKLNLDPNGLLYRYYRKGFESDADFNRTVEDLSSLNTEEGNRFERVARAQAYADAAPTSSFLVEFAPRPTPPHRSYVWHPYVMDAMDRSPAKSPYLILASSPHTGWRRDVTGRAFCAADNLLTSTGGNGFSQDALHFLRSYNNHYTKMGCSAPLNIIGVNHPASHSADSLRALKSGVRDTLKREGAKYAVRFREVQIGGNNLKLAVEIARNPNNISLLQRLPYPAQLFLARIKAIAPQLEEVASKNLGIVRRGLSHWPPKFKPSSGSLVTTALILGAGLLTAVVAVRKSPEQSPASL